MILLHTIEMTTAIKAGKKILDRVDVAFFTKQQTKTGAIEALAQLSQLNKQLNKKKVYHLLQVSDLGPWDVSQHLTELNGINLDWCIQDAQTQIPTWYDKAAS